MDPAPGPAWGPSLVSAPKPETMRLGQQACRNRDLAYRQRIRADLERHFQACPVSWPVGAENFALLNSEPTVQLSDQMRNG